MDYQERYLAHQKKKKETLMGKYEEEKTYSKGQIKDLMEVFKNRNSSRIFKEPLSQEELDYVLKALSFAPSSCDRKGVSYVVVSDREDKEILGGLLVGGVGWVHRADKIILLLADMEAYGSPAEKDFMPYLDAGVLIQSAYLAAEVLGIKCCFVNPNIRDNNKIFFNERFAHYNRFCGAIALGK